MNKTYCCCLLFLWAIGIAGAAEPVGKSRDVLFQVSTINALLDGYFDGILTCGELTQHGDLGLGTFEGLDGEMVVLDRSIYQVRADGTVHKADNSLTTPFSNVTFFETDETFELRDIDSLDQLQKALDRHMSNRNMFYAIRLDGLFAYVKARSVSKQNKPYPKLSTVTKNQTVFEWKETKGSLIGFWCPEFVQALNVPGYHLHFLSDDRKSGGHLLDCRLVEGKVSIDITPVFTLQLPAQGFGQHNLSGNHGSELNAVER